MWCLSHSVATHRSEYVESNDGTNASFAKGTAKGTVRSFRSFDAKGTVRSFRSFEAPNGEIAREIAEIRGGDRDGVGTGEHAMRIMPRRALEK